MVGRGRDAVLPAWMTSGNEPKDAGEKLSEVPEVEEKVEIPEVEVFKDKIVIS